MHPKISYHITGYTRLIGLPASDAEYVVKQPAAKVAQKINAYKTCEKPQLEVIESTFEQLPTLYNIVNQLAKLPNHGIIESGIYDLQEVCLSFSAPVLLSGRSEC